MTVLIYRDLEFNKRLNELCKAGGKGSQIAKRVEQIMLRAARNDPMRHAGFGRLTKYGEARINKCRKLNLGSGYRLIYLADASACILLFVGTHDECDRWLKHNTGFEVLEDDTKFKSICITDEARESTEYPETSAVVETDSEELMMPEIDDRTLRRIFCGLSGEKR